MKLDLTGSGVIALAAVGAVVGLGLYVYAKRDTIAKAAGQAVAAVNPADPNNLAYQGVNRVVEAATGAPPGGETLGTWLYGLKARYFPSEADRAAEQITKTTGGPVNGAILDRWDYYATSGRSAGTGSGSGADGGW